MASINCSIGTLDISSIYQGDGFQYNLPPSVLKSFFDGRAFDNKVAYTSEEKGLILQDMQDVWNRTMKDTVQEKIAVISAGAPGAGKTTQLEAILSEELMAGRNVAYIDPDAVCLKQMTRTFQREILEELEGKCEERDESTRRKAAYDKWRPASNAINHWILANLIKSGRAFYFGTTSSSPHTARLYDLLKEQGYKIRVVHLTASDEVRWESVKKRDKTFVQTTEQDIKEKGVMIHERISDTFFKYADQITFYNRVETEAPTIKAAEWLRSTDEITVHDAEAFERVKALHAEQWPR